MFTTPLVGALRQAHPDAHLTYIIESAAAPILRGNSDISELIELPRLNGLARLRHDARLAARLRASGYDVAIDLHGGPRSAWLAWGSRAPRRIGYRIKGRAWMYTDVVERQAEPSIRHSVINQWELLAPLGIPGPPSPDAAPVSMPGSPSAAAAVSARLSALGADDLAEIVAVHVSASNPFKRWPAASFATLIAGLVKGQPRRWAIVLSGPSEPEAARAVVDAARAALDVVDAARVVAPAFDLPELRALAERASVYIGGDSGPLHVASTTHTPIVAILGPTLASRSFPWRPQRCISEIVDAGPLPCRPCNERTCTPGDFRCLVGIPPARVAAAVERALTARHQVPA